MVLSSLDDDKAMDVVAIPLAGKSSIADYMVIASGTSSRQLMAMADHLGKTLKDNGVKSTGTEGAQQGDWILIDAGTLLFICSGRKYAIFISLKKCGWNQIPIPPIHQLGRYLANPLIRPLVFRPEPDYAHQHRSHWKIRTIS